MNFAAPVNISNISIIALIPWKENTSCIWMSKTLRIAEKSERERARVQITRTTCISIIKMEPHRLELGYNPRYQKWASNGPFSKIILAKLGVKFVTFNVYNICLRINLYNIHTNTNYFQTFMRNGKGFPFGFVVFSSLYLEGTELLFTNPGANLDRECRDKCFDSY